MGKMDKLLYILKEYPPLTSRMTLQLAFFEKHFVLPGIALPFRYATAAEQAMQAKATQQKNVQDYLQNRDSKYLLRHVVQKQLQSSEIHTLPYFGRWLSGFIEAEGCFTARANSRRSFSIAQKHDFYLLEAVKIFIGRTNKIRQKKNELYVLEVYKRSV